MTPQKYSHNFIMPPPPPQKKKKKKKTRSNIFRKPAKYLNTEFNPSPSLQIDLYENVRVHLHSREFYAQNYIFRHHLSFWIPASDPYIGHWYPQTGSREGLHSLLRQKQDIKVLEISTCDLCTVAIPLRQFGYRHLFRCEGTLSIILNFFI